MLYFYIDLPIRSVHSSVDADTVRVSSIALAHKQQLKRYQEAWRGHHVCVQPSGQPFLTVAKECIRAKSSTQVFNAIAVLS